MIASHNRMCILPRINLISNTRMHNDQFEEHCPSGRSKYIRLILLDYLTCIDLCVRRCLRTAFPLVSRCVQFNYCQPMGTYRLLCTLTACSSLSRHCSRSSQSSHLSRVCSIEYERLPSIDTYSCCFLSLFKCNHFEIRTKVR
jgi:hypothetical protein